jgi:hypothetical protein
MPALEMLFTLAGVIRGFYFRAEVYQEALFMPTIRRLEDHNRLNSSDEYDRNTCGRWGGDQKPRLPDRAQIHMALEIAPISAFTCAEFWKRPESVPEARH